jgi:sugar phosphate isomerase/epimerase
MQLAICSYSFHRLLAAGKQDIFKFITDCKELGCTQLDPWNAHLPTQDDEFIDRVKLAAEKAQMPWGTIAVDGAHIYEPTEEARRSNRAKAYRWIDVAAKLGAKQIRIDAGGPEDMPPDVFKFIQEGYRDIIDRAKRHNTEIIFENHWGPTVIPDNCLKLLEHIEGLGYLFDTNNWKPGLRDEGRRKLAKHATATHIKTVTWDEYGNESSSDIPTAIDLLKQSNYKGVWGIESVPKDGDEYAGCRKTIALIRRCL